MLAEISGHYTFDYYHAITIEYWWYLTFSMPFHFHINFTLTDRHYAMTCYLPFFIRLSLSDLAPLLDITYYYWISLITILIIDYFSFSSHYYFIRIYINYWHSRIADIFITPRHFALLSRSYFLPLILNIITITNTEYFRLYFHI